MLPSLNYEYIKDTSHIPRIREAITNTKAPIQFDTETTGLDYHSDKILLYQFGNGVKQFVVDARTVPIDAFKDILEDKNRFKILHNSKYDYQMLKSVGITLEGSRDTMLTEYCLTAGLQKFGRDLETVCAKYLSLELDKEMQKSFEGLPIDVRFSERQIAYAAADVAILEKILRFQWEHIKKEGLQATAMLEFDVMPAFADMEYYGIGIDRDRWLSNVKTSDKKLIEVVRELDAFAVSQKWTYYNLNDETDINWASQKQVLEKVMRKMYPEMPDTKDETLETYYIKYNHPLLDNFRTFRELAKQTGTYGASYLESIHPKTGRIHPKFNQYGAATGRPTGSKPNMLNIPRDKRYRESFIAPDGYDIHTKDYSGAELRIVASMSRDPAMCEAYNKGMDLHTYVAAKFMRLDYKELQARVAAKDEKACGIRQACKSLNFGGC